jgi:hypothetical protein
MCIGRSGVRPIMLNESVGVLRIMYVSSCVHNQERRTLGRLQPGGLLSMFNSNLLGIFFNRIFGVSIIYFKFYFDPK